MLRIASLVFMAGCAPAISAPPINAVETAQPYIGLQERTNRAELRELLDVDPARTEWCAAFVNAILELDNVPSNNDHEYPLLARSFLDWGEPVERADIKRGDVVVFPRGNSGWKGHVGFYVDTTWVDGREVWIILGGNQKNEVRYDFYSPNRALGIRRSPTPTIAVPMWAATWKNIQ